MCPVTHTKKAWHFFAFIGCFEVFDYLYLPITTSKAHAMRRERRRLTLGDNLKVSKFQSIQCSSYFAFSYSMVCITELCGFAHRRFISLLLIFLLSFINTTTVISSFVARIRHFLRLYTAGMPQHLSCRCKNTTFRSISQHILDGVNLAHRIKGKILVVHNHVILTLRKT